MEVERKIRKVGNSLAVILPSDFLKQMKLEEGDNVYMSYEHEKIILSKYGQNEKDQQFKDKVIKILDEYLEEKN
jgi:putative addiction module antidote